MSSYLSPGSDELSFADDHGTAESENESVSSNDQDEQEEDYNDSSSESEEEYEEEMKEENSRPSNASKKGRSSSGSGKASAAAATKNKRSSTGSKSKEKTVEEKYQKKVCLLFIICIMSLVYIIYSMPLIIYLYHHFSSHIIINRPNSNIFFSVLIPTLDQHNPQLNQCSFSTPKQTVSIKRKLHTHQDFTKYMMKY